MEEEEEEVMMTINNETNDDRHLLVNFYDENEILYESALARFC